MLTEWRQVQNSTYRKQEIVADLGAWKADLTSRRWQLQKVVVNPIGGLIVAILKCVAEDASTHLKVYTPFGSLVCETKWTYSCVQVLKGCWINCREFVLVFQDGVIRLYDTCCVSKPYAYTVTKKPLRFAAVCSEGAALFTMDNQIVWYDLNTKEPTAWKFLPPSQTSVGGGAHAGVAALTGAKTTAAAVVKFADVHTSADGQIYTLVVTAEGAVFQVWQNGCRQVKFTSAGAETTSSVFISFAFSHSKTFAAFTTDDGFLLITNLNPLKLGPSDQQSPSVTTTIVLTANIVSTPTLMAEQMEWLGDHCVGISSRAPTVNNPQQFCLFMGGPHSKWIDMLFATPVILVGGIDLKYLCYSSLGVIQYAEPDTMKTFSPGSCNAASMICFALDDHTATDSQGAVGEGFSGSSLTRIAQSSDWDEDTHDEIKRLEESMRKQLSEARLSQTQDLNYLYFRKKWTTKRRRRKEHDALGFIRSLTPTERLQTLSTLTAAIKYEYNLKNIVLALRAIHQISQVIKTDAASNRSLTRDTKAPEEAESSAIDLSQYYRLIRDFRIIRRITMSIEVLLNYEDFLRLRLANLIDLCQRDYNLCCELCSAYNLKLYYDPTIRVNKSPLALQNPSGTTTLDRLGALDQIGRYVNIQKSKLMLYTLINALANTSANEEAVKNARGISNLDAGRTSNELLDNCVRDLLKPGKFDEAALEGIRSAAWACLKYNKKELGCQILRAHETSKHVLLYYFRLVDDVREILRYAIDNDDTDSLEYALYLQCQNIFNMFANKSVPARFHLNQINTLVGEIINTPESEKLGPQAPIQAGAATTSHKICDAESGTGLSGEQEPKSFYRTYPSLIESFCINKFMQNEDAVTDLPNSSSVVLFRKLQTEINKLFEDSPNLVQNSGQSSQATSGSSFLSNLINPRSFIKDNKKQQVQKTIPELRKLAMFFDQTKKNGMYVDCKQGYMNYVDFIEYQNVNKLTPTLKGTAKEVIIYLITKNQEQQLKEAVAKFEIPGSIVRLWKLECLAKAEMWPVFCECAIKAIQTTTVEKRLKKLTSTSNAASSTTFNIFNLNIPFNPVHRGNQDDDVVTRLVRGSQTGDTGIAASGFTGIIGSVLSSKADPANSSFIPLLPSAVTTASNGNNVDSFCPETVPVSSFSSIAVVDFVSIAAAADKGNLALCLAPYINSASLRDRWCQSLGLRGSADEFSKNALLCAASRSGKAGAEGDYQEFIRTVKSALEEKKTMKKNVAEVGSALSKSSSIIESMS